MTLPNYVLIWKMLKIICSGVMSFYTFIIVFIWHKSIQQYFSTTLIWGRANKIEYTLIKHRYLSKPSHNNYKKTQKEG